MKDPNEKNIIKKSFNLDSIKTFSGEEKAWDLLSTAIPDEVCRNAFVSFDNSSGLYTVKSFGIDFFVSPQQRRVFSNNPLSSVILDIKEYFFEFSIVWYLVSTKSAPISGKWVKPVNVKGGQIFFMGTHQLPLDRLAEQYAQDPDGFIMKAKGFGSEVCSYADACVLLYPFPKIPIQILLWLEDEEFPPRIDLMLDSTCDIHLPTDVIWSITSTTALLMF